MLGGYFLGSLYLGKSGGSASGVLTVQDTEHGHTADSVTLVQAHSLLVDGALHGHTVDTVVLTEHQTLVVSDTLHSHIVDALSIIQQHSLTVNDTLHSHVVDGVVIQQKHVLVVEDALHDFTSESSDILQYTLLSGTADTVHGHTVDNIELVQAYVLKVDNTRHTFTLDGPINIVNWDELGVYFGEYLPDYVKSGELTAAQLAEIDLLKQRYENKGSFKPVEIEAPGLYKPNYKKSGTL